VALLLRAACGTVARLSLVHPLHFCVPQPGIIYHGVCLRAVRTIYEVCKKLVRNAYKSPFPFNKSEHMFSTRRGSPLTGALP